MHDGFWGFTKPGIREQTESFETLVSIDPFLVKAEIPHLLLYRYSYR
jgi:hypothetical protein